MKKDNLKKILSWYYTMDKIRNSCGVFGFLILLDLFFKKSVYPKYPLIFQISAFIAGILLLFLFYLNFKLKDKPPGKVLNPIVNVLVVFNLLSYIYLLDPLQIKDNFIGQKIISATEFFIIGFLPFIYFHSEKINSFFLHLCLFFLPIILFFLYILSMH